MKWFLALNQAAYEFEHYSKMLKVAIYTASKYTLLVPYFLYDGEESALTEWLRKKQVTIINCRTFLYTHLSDIAKEKRDVNYLAIGAGAFLRTEIPRLAVELGMEDEYILYTDLDVMFLDEVSTELGKLTPQYFAVAPEFDIKNYNKMNTGVMLMNIKNLTVQDSKFKDFMLNNIKFLATHKWDQTAYRMFYKRRWRRAGWDKLLPEYNWKPYWGDYSLAKIIHFHGPKPHHRRVLGSYNVPRHLKQLQPFTGGKYMELCTLWDKMLVEAENN